MSNDRISKALGIEIKDWKGEMRLIDSDGIGNSQG